VKGVADLDETDPAPPEYDKFKDWFYSEYPEGDAMNFQRLYRAYQAGYRQRQAQQEAAE
jgi:hypothetical protein